MCITISTTTHKPLKYQSLAPELVYNIYKKQIAYLLAKLRSTFEKRTIS